MGVCLLHVLLVLRRNHILLFALLACNPENDAVARSETQARLSQATPQSACNTESGTVARSETQAPPSEAPPQWACIPREAVGEALAHPVPSKS